LVLTQALGNHAWCYTSSRLQRRRPRHREEETRLCADFYAGAQVQSRSRVALVASVAVIGALAFATAYIANNAPRQVNTGTKKLESAAARAISSGFSGDDKWDGLTASLLFGPNALRAPVNLQTATYVRPPLVCALRDAPRDV
jgi:hypothetical protein